MTFRKAAAIKHVAEKMAFKREAAPSPTPSSFQGKVVALLLELEGKARQANPDKKHNMGALLGDFCLWDTVAKLAEKKAVSIRERLIDQGVLRNPKEFDTGEYDLADSPNFSVGLKVSKPISRFSADKLADLLYKSKYKIPQLVAKEFVEESKEEGNPSRTVKILEKGSWEDTKRRAVD